MTIDRPIVPQAGDLGFATIAGGVGGAINVGQAILRDACRFSHVFVVVREVGDENWPDGLIVEAMPEGARVRPLADRLVPGYAYRYMPLTAEQRAMVPAVARSFTSARDGKGVPYSFGTYAVLALAQYRVTRWSVPRLEHLIDDRGHLICSQLADELHHRIGHYLFSDGRWRGDVTPGDLWYVGDPQIIEPAPPAVDGAEPREGAS